MTENNPFLALFNQPPSEPAKSPTSITNIGQPSGCEEFDSLAEKIFRLTLKPPKQKSDNLFFMKDLAAAFSQEYFDQTTLDQAVLEYAVGMNDESLVNYLFQCFERYLGLAKQTESENVCRTIFVNLDLAFSQPELFPEQKLYEDLAQLLAFSAEESSSQFLINFVEHIQRQENETSVENVFGPLFNYLRLKLSSMHLLIGNHNALDAVLILSKIPIIAKAIVSSSILKENATKVGRHCENTLLGSLFLCSCIPRVPGTADFFDRPSRSPPGVHAATEGNIWMASERLMNKVYKIFYNLLKSSPEVQNLTRTWIGILFQARILSF